MLGGRYTLGSRLEDAPHRSTWQAQDTTLDRRVQLLVVGHEHPASEDVLDAARRAAAVDDPRLVRVLDVGHDEGVTYVVTEWLDGRDLATLVSGGPMAAEQARAVVGEASLALEAARRRGLHHLRLRPSLVHLLEDGSIKVEGLVTEAALDQVEVEDGNQASRLDVHGLVAVAYAALTGRWPEDDDPQLAAAPKVRGTIAAPAQLVAGVPADLDALCAQELAGQGGPATPGDLAGQIAPWGPKRRSARTPGSFPHALPPVRLAPGTPGSPGAPLQPETGARPASGPPAGQRVNAVRPAGGSSSADRTRELRAVRPGADQTTAAVTAPTPTTSEPTTGPTAPTRPTSPGADQTTAAITAPTPTTSGPDPTTGPTTAPTPTTDPGRDQTTAAVTAPTPTTAPPARTTPSRETAATDRTRPAPVPAPPPAETAAAVERPAAVARPATTPAARPAPRPVPAAAASTPGPGSRSLPADLLGLAKGGSAQPAAGATAARPPRQASRAAIAVVVAFLVVALGLAWKGLSGLTDSFPGTGASTSPTASSKPSASKTSATASPSASSTPVTVQRVAGFDPQGDGGENDGDAELATDGDPQTFWSSETYRSAKFGGLKRGVGLRLDLDGRQDVHRVEVELGVSGATVQLRRANGDRLSSRVLDEKKDASGTVTLEPEAAVAADEVVVWFTRAARSEGGYRVEVAEVKVS